jgi:hypothetical protein
MQTLVPEYQGLASGAIATSRSASAKKTFGDLPLGLQRNAIYVVRNLFDHHLAEFGAAGEGNLVDVGMCLRCTAGFTKDSTALSSTDVGVWQNTSAHLLAINQYLTGVKQFVLPRRIYLNVQSLIRQPAALRLQHFPKPVEEPNDSFLPYLKDLLDAAFTAK